MQHTKSPPSLLPELKLLTICTTRKQLITQNSGFRRKSQTTVSDVATLTDLSLHVHDDHCVGAVAHDKVLRVLGQQDDVIDCDVSAG